MTTPTLAIYTSHDSSIAVRARDGTYRVAELERIAGTRYYSLDADLDGWHRTLGIALNQITAWQPELGDSYLSLFPNVAVTSRLSELGLTPASSVGHHDAHAACAFYQSPYDRATVVTYDGGGPDADGTTQHFCIYNATRATGCTRRSAIPFNLGTAYNRAATVVSEIMRTSAGSHVNALAGKLMALAAYGNVDENALSAVERYLIGENALGATFDHFHNRPFDWCATVQRAFESVAVANITYLADKSTPLVLSGGCALNCKVNQALRDAGYTVFIPPNPNDSGLALGMLLAQDRPAHQVVCTFNGMDWPGGEEHYPTITLADVAARLQSGQIIGFVEGSSELGPRALGHRSILCKGSLPHARARLNAIKGREWFRPVSPVFAFERVVKWTETEPDHARSSPFMSFARHTNAYEELAEWEHIDGTARIQTVQEGCSLYSLIEACHWQPLINTSLNLRGRPLCNSMEDALTLLHTTSLDALIINGHLIEK